MPKGIPRAGFRRTGKRKSRTLQELEQELALKVPDIVAELEKLTRPIQCPHCGNEIRIIDKDVGMYLVDRALGKPKQKHEVDVTENIQLTADQIDKLLYDRFQITLEDVQRYLMEQKKLLPEAPPGNTEAD